MAGSGTTPTILRGLLVPDPRFRWDTAAATATSQAGPLPGVPEAQSDTEMVLEATGTQASTSSLRVKTVRAGHPDADAARFVWKYDADAGTSWRGWDPPSSITGFEFVHRSTTAEQWLNPHARTLADDSVLVMVDTFRTRVLCWVMDPATGTWSSSEVYDRGSAQTYSFWPCSIVLSSGRVLCFFWVESTAGDYQIRMYYSDDSGATWTQGQKGCLSAAIDVADYRPGRIRGDILNDQIMLVVHMQEQATPEDQLFQFASNDLGATLEQVSVATGKNRAYVDVLAHGGRLLVAYISESDSSPGDFFGYMRPTGSAYTDWLDGELVRLQDDTDGMQWGTESGGLYNSGEITLWADEDGVLYVMGRDHGSGDNEVAIRASTDGGSTWSELGAGLAAHEGVSTWRGLDAATYPKSMACTAQRGRTVCLHSFAANPGTADDSLCAMWLGGYTTVCLPQEAGRGRVALRTVTGWTVTWLPYDLPEVTGAPTWASSTGGAPTVALGSTGVRIQHAGVGDSQSWVGSPVTNLSDGVIVLAEVQVTAGTGYVGAGSSDGVNCYWIKVRVTPTSIVLRDDNAGTTLATIATTAGATGVQILAAVAGDNCYAWYRPVDATRSDREWILIGSSTGLTSAAFPSADVSFGTLSGSAVADVSFRLVCYVDDVFTGEQLAGGQDNWSDLLGRGYQPTPVYVDGGTAIQAVDGPTFRNDDWHIDPRYTYPISNVFPDVAASPRRAWRSTSDAVDQEITWTLGDEATPTMGALVGLYLGGCNFGEAELWGKDATDTWISVCTIDLRAQTGLKWTRDGRVVRPDTSGGSSIGRYLPQNILAGDHIKLKANKVRKIATNSPGTWSSGGTSLATRILLTEADGTETGSGSAAVLWSRDCLTVVPVASTDVYKAWKLTIPAQDTAEDYFTIGSMVFGHIFPLGSYLMQYGWGRAVEWATTIEQVEGRSGIRSAHALAPGRRAVEMSWVDGVETSGLTDESPNWIIGWTAGDPVAVPADITWSMPGLIEHLQGEPGVLSRCVYVAAYTVTGNAPVYVTDRRQLLYGRIASESLRADTVLGGEEGTELIRLGTVRIEEDT